MAIDDVPRNVVWCLCLEDAEDEVDDDAVGRALDFLSFSPTFPLEVSAEEMDVFLGVATIEAAVSSSFCFECFECLNV